MALFHSLIELKSVGFVIVAPASKLLPECSHLIGWICLVWLQREMSSTGSCVWVPNYALWKSCGTFTRWIFPRGSWASGLHVLCILCFLCCSEIICSFKCPLACFPCQCWLNPFLNCKSKRPHLSLSCSCLVFGCGNEKGSEENQCQAGKPWLWWIWGCGSQTFGASLWEECSPQSLELWESSRIL